MNLAGRSDALRVVHTAFYQFTAVDDPAHLAAALRVAACHLLGSILVAREGINGVLAGSAAAVQAFEQWLRQDPRFAAIAFKRSACTTAPFGRMKVHLKPEIVAVGLPPQAAALPPGGERVSPQSWRALLQRDDVVVLDNRNSFEFRLGHFKTALDPGVRHFRDFPEWVRAQAPLWRAQQKSVAMYCTGGVRCDKTSAWMAHELGLPVYALDGGILNFFQTLPDAAQDWQGECFVFDNRIALGPDLQETPTTLEAVYQHEPDGAWRLARARRLAQG
jgi:UPF0176 protein